MEWISVISYGSVFAIVVFLIGFGAGRRSAYRDFEMNLPLPVKYKPVKHNSFKAHPAELIGAKK